MFWFPAGQEYRRKARKQKSTLPRYGGHFMVKQKRFIVNYDRVIEGFKLANDIMLSSLLIAKAKGGNYPVGQRQFYENLRAVANGEKNKNARNVSETAAINRRMSRRKQFEALKLIEAYKIIREKYDKIGQAGAAGALRRHKPD
jgi:hypothetical protein